MADAPRHRLVAPRSDGAGPVAASRHGVSPEPSAEPGPVGVLGLQATAGNRAVASAIASSDPRIPRTMPAAALLPRPRATPAPAAAAVQRAPITSWLGPDTSAAAPVNPGALVLQPAGGSKPAAQMSYEELGDAIDDIDLEVGEHLATTPEGLRLEARRAELLVARDKLAGQAVRGGPVTPPGKGRKAGTGAAPGGDRKRGRKTEPSAAKEMPPKPDTLRGSLNLAAMKPGAIKAEMDRVVAYLAAGPSKDEREVLVMELPNLEAAAGIARQERHAEKRNEKLAEALGPTKGDEADQLAEMLKRIQGAQPDPSREHGWLIYHDGKAYPLMATELMALKGQVADGLTKGAAAVNGMMWDVHQAWQDRTDTNRKHNWVHGLVKFTTGADDISAAEIQRAVDAGDGFVRNVRMLGNTGLLTDAGRQLLVFDRYTRHMAKKIGEWESDLMGGAGRWVLALTIVKEALTIMSGVGAVGLATKAGGGALGMLQAGAEITAMTTATGGASAYLGATVAGSDRGQATRLGLGAGFGVGANALTAGASKFAAIGDAAKATGAARKALMIGKAVGVDMAANTAVGVSQALIEGGSVKNAIIGGVVTSPINTLGGGLVEAAGMGHLATAGGKALVGTGAGGAGALATGDNAAVGMLKGGLGSVYGSASNHLYGPTGLGKDTPIGGAPAPDPGVAPLGLPAGVAAPLALPAGGPTAGSPFLPGATTASPGIAPVAAPDATPGGAPAANPDADLDAHFANLEGDIAGHNPEGTTLHHVDQATLTDARFSRQGGSELDLRAVADVTVQDGSAPLTPGAGGEPVRQAGLPPETWLLDPARARNPTPGPDTQFRPNRRADNEYDVRNAQVIAGPGGDRVATPQGPVFGPDRVVGGGRGATLDPASGSWTPAGAPHQRPFNPLGQDAQFGPRTPDEWHAWEQAQGPLTDEQRYAAWFYSDDLSGHLNPALRGEHAGEFVTDPVAMADAAGDLDATMRPVPFDTVVHRKASMSDFSDLKVTDPAELAGKKGQTYSHEGYTSTAVVEGKWSGEVDIVIQVPKGTRGRYLAGKPGAPAANPVNAPADAPLASMPDEMEFLVERGTTFTVQDARVDPGTGRWTVEVRIAEQGVRPTPLSNPVPLPGTPAKP